MPTPGLEPGYPQIPVFETGVYAHSTRSAMLFGANGRDRTDMTLSVKTFSMSHVYPFHHFGMNMVPGASYDLAIPKRKPVSKTGVYANSTTRAKIRL